MGNITLLIASFLFICIVTIYLIKKWPDFDVVDLYIVFILLHFGFYPFVRGLYFGRDVIFDFRQANPLALSLVFLLVFINVLFVRVVTHYLPSKWQRYLQIRYLIDQWASINQYFLILLYIGLIIFPLISYYKYGIRTYILPDDFAKIGSQLPYWLTSVRTIYNYLAFCIFLGLFANLIKSPPSRKTIWLVLTIIFVPIATIFGRRYFLNILVVAVVFWFAYRRENIFRLKYLAVGLALFICLLLFSNVYQSYRYVLQTVGQVNQQKLKNPLAAALNFSSTIHNITARPGTWEFDFLVIDHQINRRGMFTYGRVSWEGFKSAVPRILWPPKHFSLIDDILAKLYEVKPKKIDIGKNIFGIAQVDFGYYSMIIIPLLITIIIAILAGLVSISTNYPTFLVLFSGNIIFYLVNVEENGNELFFMFRKIIILLILFAGYVLANKFYLAWVKNKSPN